jgi:hypothetical protein
MNHESIGILPIAKTWIACPPTALYNKLDPGAIRTRNDVAKAATVCDFAAYLAAATGAGHTRYDALRKKMFGASCKPRTVLSTGRDWGQTFARNDDNDFDRVMERWATDGRSGVLQIKVYTGDSHTFSVERFRVGSQLYFRLFQAYQNVYSLGNFLGLHVKNEVAEEVLLQRRRKQLAEILLRSERSRFSAEQKRIREAWQQDVSLDKLRKGDYGDLPDYRRLPVEKGDLTIRSEWRDGHKDYKTSVSIWTATLQQTMNVVGGGQAMPQTHFERFVVRPLSNLIRGQGNRNAYALLTACNACGHEAEVNNFQWLAIMMFDGLEPNLAASFEGLKRGESQGWVDPGGYGALDRSA